MANSHNPVWRLQNTSEGIQHDSKELSPWKASCKWFSRKDRQAEKGENCWKWSFKRDVNSQSNMKENPLWGFLHDRYIDHEGQMRFFWMEDNLKTTTNEDLVFLQQFMDDKNEDEHRFRFAL